MARIVRYFKNVSLIFYTKNSDNFDTKGERIARFITMIMIDQFKHQLNKIGLFFKALRPTLRHAFPNLFMEMAIFVAVLSLICFAGGISYMATKSQSDVFLQQGEVDPPHEVDFELNNTEQNNTEDTTPQNETIQYSTSQMCFIGDSRMVGMETAVYTDAHFIAESSMGLDWFNETATIEFEQISNNIKVCVVALGINDMWRLDEYITTFNEFANKYQDTIFIYATIGPVDETQYTAIPNSSIEEFNKTMISGLGDRWQIIDQYTYLASNGFSSYDGLHYGNAVSAGIFAWMVESVSTQSVDVTN